jgi:hypothetical protein
MVVHGQRDAAHADRSLHLFGAKVVHSAGGVS